MGSSASLEAANKEAADAKKRLAEVQKEFDDYKSMKEKEDSKTQQRVTSQDSTIGELREQITSYKSQAETADRLLSTHMRGCRDLPSQLEKAQNRAAELQRSLKQATAEAATWKEEAERWQGESVRAHAEADEARKQADSLQTLMDQLSSRRLMVVSDKGRVFEVGPVRPTDPRR